jgi:ABC-type antimicrobial peptide transport system permease subunit
LDGIEDRRDRKQKDDLRDDFRGDRYSPPIVNVNISNNNQQQTKVMTEPEKPRLKNHSKTKEIKLPPVVVASMAFVLLFLTTAALVLTFAGILNITSFIIAMFSIVLLIVIGVSFILKVTGQIEGQSFEKIILAVLKQLTLYDAFLGKIGDILGKSKNK